MKNLAGNTITDAALKVKWLDLLPPNAAMLLRIVDKENVAELAEVADRLIEQGGSPMTVAPVSTQPQYQPQQMQPMDLVQEIIALKAAVAQLATFNRQLVEQHTQSGSRQRNRSRARSNSRQRYSNNTQGHCWYHIKFGANARRCTQPCTFCAIIASPNNNSVPQGNV